MLNQHSGVNRDEQRPILREYLRSARGMLSLLSPPTAMNVEIILPKMVLGQKRIATICIRTKETFGQGGMLPHRPTKPAAGRKRKRQCRYRQRTSDHPTLNQSSGPKEICSHMAGLVISHPRDFSATFPLSLPLAITVHVPRPNLGDHHSSFPKPARFTAAIFSFKQLHVALSAKVQKRHPSSIGRIKQNLTSGFLLNYLRDPNRIHPSSSSSPVSGPEIPPTPMKDGKTMCGVQ
jgi:hypothetical protein